MFRRSVFACVALAGAAARAQAPAEDDERLNLRAEAGLEIDTNAHRTEIIAGVPNPPIVTSSLERFVFTGTLADVVADRQAVIMSATLAGKLFNSPAATDEDVAIVQTGLAWQRLLRPGGAFTLDAAYYEAFQRASANLLDAEDRRDFRSFAPSLRFGWPVGDGVELTATGGYRWFVFKPDRDFDFSAPTAALDLRWTYQPEDGADWEAQAGVGFEPRSFGGPALIGNCPQPGFACSGPLERHDDFLNGRVELTRVGRVLTGLGYGLQYNRSDSYGETVVRHALSLRFAARFLGIVLALRGELLLAHYPQPPPLGQTTIITGTSIESLDSENRSTLRVDLSRDLNDWLRVFARYTYYVNETTSGSPVSYHRQTALLSLVASWDR
ncbi:MAG TPA: hypothetical protein VMT03_21055 [Polyangia bacterium]|nr:hypothetical protein [Polyangia bacterium]